MSNYRLYWRQTRTSEQIHVLEYNGIGVVVSATLVAEPSDVVGEYDVRVESIDRMNNADTLDMMPIPDGEEREKLEAAILQKCGRFWMTEAEFGMELRERRVGV